MHSRCIFETNVEFLFRKKDKFSFNAPNYINFFFLFCSVCHFINLAYWSIDVGPAKSGNPVNNEILSGSKVGKQQAIINYDV